MTVAAQPGPGKATMDRLTALARTSLFSFKNPLLKAGPNEQPLETSQLERDFRRERYWRKWI